MRGKEYIDVSRYQGLRITPAYAGKRQVKVERCGENWDHPRVCGEKRFCGVVAHRLLGSPPRMRGKAEVREYRRLQEGITPAYAGKRANQKKQASKSQDHPRVCGEKTEKIP